MDEKTEHYMAASEMSGIADELDALIARYRKLPDFARIMFRETTDRDVVSTFSSLADEFGEVAADVADLDVEKD